MTETPSTPESQPGGDPSAAPPPAYQPPPPPAGFPAPPADTGNFPPPPAAGYAAPPAGYNAPPPAAAYGAPPMGYAAPAPGPVGQIRPTGKCIFFFIITLGIYGWFWYYNVFKEMKEHRHDGLGGGLALILGIFVSIVMVFLTPSEVGNLYKSRGQAEPVTAMTGFWVLLPLAGGIVWFVKTNGALNDYWRSLGATG